MKILLLEDNKKLQLAIKKRLLLKGYSVNSFSDGRDAYESITDGYGCFVLDINVPSLDGVFILRKIREYYEDTPVIIISSTVELDVIKESYGFGCSDFIKKPFFIEELEIKIEKLCNVGDGVIYFDKEAHFNHKESTIVMNGREQRLTKKERLLINLLLIQKNRVVSYESIESYVWEGNMTSLESIRTLIRRVRKVVGSQYIQTVVDVGYIFNAEADT